MSYKGVIIEESLANADVLKNVAIIDTRIESVTAHHKTPWLKQWTLHTVKLTEDNIDAIAEEISTSLEKDHNWYADFKNGQYHYIIYRNKVFKVDLNHPRLYKNAREYGISIGIPEYQIDFAPNDKVREK